jgi:hypothetical protein
MAQHVKIEINRAPVLTLWAAVVAERLGFDHDEALTLGRAVAGLNAYSKGKRLGLFEPSPEAVKRKRKEAKETFEVELLHRAVPVLATPQGIRAEAKGKPTNPKSVEKYLEAKFGENLKAARDAMVQLAKAFPPQMLASKAYRLYEQFRPEIPKGVEGWGAKGILDLGAIKNLSK